MSSHYAIYVTHHTSHMGAKGNWVPRPGGLNEAGVHFGTGFRASMTHT